MLVNETEYLSLLEQIKAEIVAARLRARAAVCREGSLHYWRLGQMLNERSEWGSKYIDNLSRDIRLAYPGIEGYSRRNLMNMARFARTYPDLGKVQQPVALLPWGHNITLMTKVADSQARQWYADQAIQNGWSRTILDVQIDTDLYHRQITAKKTTNFHEQLPPPQSDLAEQTLKEPYIFDFIESSGTLKERELERQMVANISRLLLELGAGFTFVGQQYHIEVDGQDFYIDLLFYQLKLRCFVVVELKATDFKPDYAGQISFYVTAVDRQLRHVADNPTIGLLLCKGKTGLVAEYALTSVDKPIGVAEYQLVSTLPPELADLLPSAEDIANRVDIEGGDDEQP